MMERKLISAILIFTLLMTMSVSVFAASTTITGWNFDSSLSKTSGSYSKAFSDSGTGNVSYNADGFLIDANTKLVCNYKKDLYSNVSGDYPVISFKYDICIPDGTYINHNRYYYMTVSSSTSSSTDKSAIYVDYTNGNFSIGSNSTGITEVYSKEYTYTPNSWVTIEVRGYYNSDKKLDWGIYVENEQIYYGTGTITYPSVVAIYQIFFQQASGATTYLNDASLSVMSADNAPTDPTIYAPEIESSNNSVSVKADLTNYTGENAVLVTAVFDDNGKLKKTYTNNTIDTDKLITQTIDSQYIVNNYVVKAFIFDSLSSAKPLAESSSITLSVEK